MKDLSQLIPIVYAEINTGTDIFGCFCIKLHGNYFDFVGGTHYTQSQIVNHTIIDDDSWYNTAGTIQQNADIENYRNMNKHLA
jgi:hypothetical protein